jgi:hypothetical protein
MPSDTPPQLWENHRTWATASHLWETPEVTTAAKAVYQAILS